MINELCASQLLGGGNAAMNVIGIPKSGVKNTDLPENFLLIINH